MRLSELDRRGLSWVQHFARSGLTRLKRARKYRPREPVIDEGEVEVLQALIDLEQAAGRLLDT